ncbi:MAG: hydroxymethylglutaryl-CoA reductase, degradative [Spirochaetota bacterium]
MILPEGFRRLDPETRRARLGELFCDRSEGEEFLATGRDPALVELSSLMVESSIGYAPIPLGIAGGFVIDGQRFDIPMATEEPSVIAAATYAARIIARGGGFHTWATDPVMATQIFLEGVTEAGGEKLLASEARIRAEMEPILASLAARGGGWRGMRVARLPGTGLLKVDFDIDVRDAMGANILNTAAEGVCPLVEELSGGKRLMCILSNAAEGRRGRASFTLPFGALASVAGSPGEAVETARRIVLATALANEDPSRAVTHNKGVMNGISALALATFNDCRSIEAAAHAWAARDGAYRSLSSYRVEGEALVGELELPLSFGAVGGAAAFHPASRLALKFLGSPGAPELARIAAALGLAQNFAALLALVTGGIQRGHMRYHAPRIAYMAGARGEEVAQVAATLTAEKNFRLAYAESVLAALRQAAPYP